MIFRNSTCPEIENRCPDYEMGGEMCNGPSYKTQCRTYQEKHEGRFQRWAGGLADWILTSLKIAD